MRLFQLPEPYSDIGLVSESENKKKIQRRNEDFKIKLIKIIWFIIITVNHIPWLYFHHYLFTLTRFNF